MKNYRPVIPREYGTTPDVITRAYDQVGGPKRVETILARRPSQIQAYSHPNKAQRLSFAQARQLAAAGAVAFAEALAADCGGYFVAGEARATPIERLVGEEAMEQGALVADVMAWIERARSPGDRVKLAADLDLLIATTAALRRKIGA